MFYGTDTSNGPGVLQAVVVLAVVLVPYWNMWYGSILPPGEEEEEEW